MTDEMLAELRPHEAAKYLRVSKATVYDLLKTGALEGRRDANGRWRISRAACNRCIANLDQAGDQAAVDRKFEAAGRERLSVVDDDEGPAKAPD